MPVNELRALLNLPPDHVKALGVLLDAALDNWRAQGRTCFHCGADQWEAGALTFLFGHSLEDEPDPIRRMATLPALCGNCRAITWIGINWDVVPSEDLRLPSSKTSE